MSADQPRTPAGSPTGGQFAVVDRPEADVDLSPSLEVRARRAIEDLVLEKFPAALSWEVGAERRDGEMDEYEYDSQVRAEVRDPQGPSGTRFVAIDLHGSSAYDHVIALEEDATENEEALAPLRGTLTGPSRPGTKR